SPALGFAAVRGWARPMYLRPCSNGAVPLVYCWPPSAYSRYIQPVRGLYDGDWEFVPPTRVGYTKKLPSGLELEPVTAIGRPLAPNTLNQWGCTNGVPDRSAPFVRSST